MNSYTKMLEPYIKEKEKLLNENKILKEKLKEIERLCIGGRIKDHLTDEQCINSILEVLGNESNFQQYTEEIQKLKDNALNEHLMNVALLDAIERLKIELEYKSEVLGDLDEENKKLRDIIHEIKNEFEELGSVPWQTKDVIAVALENIDNIINSLGEEKNEKEN